MVAGRILGLDGERLLSALRTCLAILVGYALALRFEWNASFIATTIIVLQTASLGATFRKAALRMSGTLAGAVVGLAMVGLFAHEKVLFVLAMALLTAFCVWSVQTSRHQYAWMLVVVTAGIVGWPSAMNPANVFQSGVDRVTAVTVGVLLSGVSQAVFWPQTGGQKYERHLRQAVAGCSDLLQAVQRGLFEPARPSTASPTGLLKLSSMLAADLDAAVSDTVRFRRHFQNYQQLNVQLADWCLASASLQDAAERFKPTAADAQLSTSSALIQRGLGAAANSAAAVASQLSEPRDGKHRPIQVDVEPAAEPAKDLVAVSPAGCVLAARLRAYSEAADRVRESLGNVEVADPAAAITNPPHPAPPGLRARLGKSALAAAQVVLGSVFFMWMAWPLGVQSAMIPLMIMSFAGASAPLALTARYIIRGLAAALPLGAAFYFLLMPRLDSFALLAPCFGLFLLPFLYTIASRNPLVSLAGTMSVLIAKSLVSISTTPPSYDLTAFATTYLGMSGGFALILLLATVCETRSPRRGIHKLLSGILMGVAGYLRDIKVPDGGDAERKEVAGKLRSQSMQRLTQAKKLVALVDFREDPAITSTDIRSVLQAYDLLSVRMFGAAGWYDPASFGRDDVQHAHARCVNALNELGKALGELDRDKLERAVDSVQPGESTPEQTSSETGSAATFAPEGDADENRDAHRRLLLGYYQGLADAILSCQRNLQAVNWKRWCANHF